jgi:hypothetical protein
MWFFVFRAVNFAKLGRGICFLITFEQTEEFLFMEMIEETHYICSVFENPSVRMM